MGGGNRAFGGHLFLKSQIRAVPEWEACTDSRVFLLASLWCPQAACQVCRRARHSVLHHLFHSLRQERVVLRSCPHPGWKHHAVPMWNFQQLLQPRVGVWRMNSKAEARSAEGTGVRKHTKSCQTASWSLSEHKRWEAGQDRGYRSGPMLSGDKFWLFHLETARPSRTSFPPCTMTKSTMRE